MTDTLTATLRTNQGPVVIRLFPDHAPKTVRNFVELAEGGRQWTDPRTGRATTDKLYDGTVFHRVIPDFMIQGGDPLGSGRGGPGYEFADEIHPDLAFDRPYLLAMANAGPGTNGSQFFITVSPTPWLNGKHTIFGEVIEGADVVDLISRVKTGSQDRPVEDVTIESVTVERGNSASSLIGPRREHAQRFRIGRPSRPDGVAPGPGGDQIPTCYRHPGRETYVSCVRCGRYACPDCMRSASVGQQCVECVGEGARSTRQARTTFGGRPAAGAVVTWTLVAIDVAVFLVTWVRPGIVTDLEMLGYAPYTAGRPAARGSRG